MIRAVVVVLLAALVPVTSGCGTDCGDVDCGGQGLYVSWAPSDVPDGESHRLCADGACQRVEPSNGQTEDGDRILEVSVTSPAERGDEIAARFEVLDADGAVVARYEGTGERRGRCCPAAVLVVDGPGRLVEEDG